MAVLQNRGKLDVGNAGGSSTVSHNWQMQEIDEQKSEMWQLHHVGTSCDIAQPEKKRAKKQKINKCSRSLILDQVLILVVLMTTIRKFKQGIVFCRC